MAAAEDRVDALYGLPFERFVPERDALVKALRADGDRTGADAVKRLAKPTRAAWAVNAAVRAHPAAARTLREAAALLGAAQQELLAGGDASALRKAGDRARAAVDALAAAAPAAGHATADKVRATLHAATVDPDVLEEVGAGRVVREHAASGFGGLDAMLAAGSAGRRAARPRARARDRPKERQDAPVRTAPSPAPDAREERRRAKEQQARTAAARDATRRREKLRRAKEAEAEAKHGVDAARRALEQVESALADRRSQLREAQARLGDARRRRERAER